MKEVNVFNKTSAPVGRHTLRSGVLAVWDAFFPRRAGTANFIFVGAAGIKKLNREYLARRGSTDVISFYYTTSPREIDGDVFISVPQAAKQAAAAGWKFSDEIMLLAVHGFLHLAGYEDYTPKQRERMFRLQRRALSALGVKPKNNKCPR